MVIYVMHNKTNELFSFLPVIVNYKKKEIPDKVKESIEYVATNDEYKELYEEITNQIYYRLTTKDEEYAWNLKHYGKFKEAVKTLSLMDVVGTSIIKCLNASNTEIYNELVRLSERVDWYPEGDRVKDSVTNKYTYKLREINHMDCYFVIKNILSQMLSSISRYVRENFGILDDIDLKIDYMLKNIDCEFYNIDEEFKYLEEFPFFCDLYVNMKKRTNKQLLKFLQNELIIKKKRKII